MVEFTQSQPVLCHAPGNRPAGQNRTKLFTHEDSLSVYLETRIECIKTEGESGIEVLTQQHSEFYKHFLDYSRSSRRILTHWEHHLEQDVMD